MPAPHRTRRQRRSTLARPMWLPLIAALHAAGVAAQTTASQPVFQLGEVDVQTTAVAKPPPGGTSSSVVTQQQMLDRGALDVGDALADLPGVTPVTLGQRGETQVNIRGFDSRQTTLNIDGIPIYVPYDGNVDLSRLLTPGISEIVVTKGLGSLMYGPNNMGGSINIVTQAPTKKLEGSITGGLTANQHKLYGNDFSVQLGSRIDNRWYVQGGVAAANRDGFPLSGDFRPVPAQPGGDRLNAASHDINANLKIGFTPNATDDYALGVYTVNSDKDSPPYTGNTKRTGQPVRYWRWPQWNKQSVYFIGNTAIGSGYLKTRLYHDTFDNQLISYDDASYTTTKKPYAFNSKYRDFSNGATVELGQPLGAQNFLKLGLFYKQDVHRESNLATQYQPYQTPWLRFEAHTYALGFENAYRPTEADTITFGYRRDEHRFDQAQEYANKAQTQIKPLATSPRVGANNWQVVWRHRMDAHTELRAGIGQKTRFPSIKEVYSYRLGQAIPNPALGPEQALNREVGISGVVLGGVKYDAAVYWDSIKDAIESVATATPGISQAQNVGTATNKGLDLSVQAPIGNAWIASLAYSYLNATLGSPGLLATNAPRHWGDLGISWLPGDATTLSAHLQAASGRQTTTNGKQPVAGFAVVNLRWAQRLAPRLTLYTNLNNLFDRNYALSEGFPMPGRELRVQLQYRL
ncbi:MAG: TonB-dependent receptor plug domain-containing protein [Thiomonas sp.]